MGNWGCWEKRFTKPSYSLIWSLTALGKTCHSCCQWAPDVFSTLLLFYRYAEPEDYAYSYLLDAGFMGGMMVSEDTGRRQEGGGGELGHVLPLLANDKLSHGAYLSEQQRPTEGNQTPGTEMRYQGSSWHIEGQKPTPGWTNKSFLRSNAATCIACAYVLFLLHFVPS